jgi:hypothetical protein
VSAGPANTCCQPAAVGPRTLGPSRDRPRLAAKLARVVGDERVAGVEDFTDLQDALGFSTRVRRELEADNKTQSDEPE